MKPVYVAGIDVHKAMLAVVIGASGVPEAQWQRRRFGTSMTQIRLLAAWLKRKRQSNPILIDGPVGATGSGRPTLRA